MGHLTARPPVDHGPSSMVGSNCQGCCDLGPGECHKKVPEDSLIGQGLGFWNNANCQCTVFWTHMATLY